MDVMREAQNKNKNIHKGHQGNNISPNSPKDPQTRDLDAEKKLETLHRYQDMYNKDPESKIFAPLAEAYRKTGHLEHALEIAQKGIQLHPEFASGQVTLARILIDMGELLTAIKHLKLATEMSPDNFLAHKLLGETYIALKEPSKALQVFKMALYLDPMDNFAKKMVKKLESFSAIDFTDDSLFEEREIAPSPVTTSSTPPLNSKQSIPPRNLPSHDLDRYVSLIDAYISRNDYDRATKTLKEALDKLGKSPELQRRQIFLSQRFEDSSQKISEIDTSADRQIKLLQRLLHQIEDRRVY